MWKTRDGAILRLPFGTLRRLASERGVPEPEMLSEIGKMVLSARRVGSFRSRKDARNYPVFGGRRGPKSYRLVTRPLGRPVARPVLPSRFGGRRTFPGYAILGVESFPITPDPDRWDEPLDTRPSPVSPAVPADSRPSIQRIPERAAPGGASLVIDCHCHAGTGDGFTGPWDTRAPLDRYLVRAARAGIHRTVVFPAFTTDYRAANREVASLVRRHRGRLLGFAMVHAARDRGRIGEMVREAAQDLGLLGIKVHAHDARISREVCEAARRHSLPILYDVAGEVASVELFAGEYPDVPFIIPHLGSFADDWRAQRGLLAPLERLPNVHTDTSGVRRFDILQEAVRRAGPHKVLFGTDGPWLHPAVELAKIRALGLSGPDEGAILGGNLMRLLRRSLRANGGSPTLNTGRRAQSSSDDTGVFFD